MCRNINKAKILIVHNYYQLVGGEDTVVQNEKKMLEDNGHEVTVYSRHNLEIKQMNVLQKLLLPFISMFNIKTYLDIKKIIKTKSIDIIHIHNTLHLISPAVYYAAISCGVPVVQTVHNFRFLCPGAVFYRDGQICEECVNKGMLCAVKYKCYRDSYIQTAICVLNIWLHRHTGILRRINYICLTEFNRQKMLSLKFIKDNRVYVKPNFTYCCTPKVIKGRKFKYYLFVGRIEKIKGVDLLIEAFERMSNINLLLAGEGPLKRKLEKRKSKNIKFVGKVSHDEIMNMISVAKAVILPSQCYEGFSMTILESISTGTPIITGDIGNNGIVVKEMVNGLKFKYDSVNSLCETVNRLEKCDYDKLRKSTYEDYLNNYQVEMNYKTLLHIYDEVEQRCL